jgi:hypothetical protein
MKKVLAAVAVVLLAAVVAPAARADCDAGVSRLIGNLDSASSEQWNLKDPSADFAYFFVENPAINEGAFGEPSAFRGLFFDLLDAGSTLDEAFLGVADIGTGGLSTAGCPSSGMRMLALMTDRRGTTCVSVVDHGDAQWNWDTAAGGSTLTSPLLGVPVLQRSTMGLRVAGATRLANGSVDVSISWSAPSCNMDAPFTLPVASYDVFKLVLARTATGSADPSNTQGTPERIATGLTGTSTTVNLPATTGTDTFLIVGANLGNSGRAAMSATSSPIATDPTLATAGPGKGRGKGLTKAPGQTK